MGQSSSRFLQGNMTIVCLHARQVVKASDFGRNDRTFFVRTHLGHLLGAGDCALGYDMSTANTVRPRSGGGRGKGLCRPRRHPGVPCVPCGSASCCVAGRHWPPCMLHKDAQCWHCCWMTTCAGRVMLGQVCCRTEHVPELVIR